MNTILRKKPVLKSSELKENVPLSGYTTFGVGGSADYFCVVESEKDLVELLKWSRDLGLPFLTLGGGSNLLIDDKGFRGLILKLEGCFKQIRRDNEKLTAGAGVFLRSLWKRAMEYSLGGWEQLSGIPGTVGGAIVVNAGTNYGEIGALVSRVRVIDENGIKPLSQNDLEFSYRKSGINPGKEIVLEAEFLLFGKEKELIDRDVKKYMIKRQASQPLDFKSAGCIFKNPKQGPAAKFIDDAGLK